MYVYYQSPFDDVTKEFVVFWIKLSVQQREVRRVYERAQNMFYFINLHPTSAAIEPHGPRSGQDATV